MPRLPRPSPAMAVALIALVAATGGVGYAQTQERIDGARLLDRSVSTPKLKIGAVRAPQLSTGAVTTTKLRTASVTARKVAPGAIGTTELADGGVRAPDIGEAGVGTLQLADGWVLAADLAAGAVGEAKIGPGAVTRSRLAAEAQVPLTVVRRSAVAIVGDGEVGQATAVCAPGERLLSGGAGPANTGASADFHPVGGLPLPNGDGDVPTQWVGYVRNEVGGVGPQQMLAFAVCARVG